MLKLKSKHSYCTIFLFYPVRSSSLFFCFLLSFVLFFLLFPNLLFPFPLFLEILLFTFRLQLLRILSELVSHIFCSFSAYSTFSFFLLFPVSTFPHFVPYLYLATRLLFLVLRYSFRILQFPSVCMSNIPLSYDIAQTLPRHTSVRFLRRNYTDTYRKVIGNKMSLLNMYHLTRGIMSAAAVFPQ